MTSVDTPAPEWLVPAGLFRAHLWVPDGRGGMARSYCRRWVGRWAVGPPRPGVRPCLRCAVEATARGEPLPPWTVNINA